MHALSSDLLLLLHCQIEATGQHMLLRHRHSTLLRVNIIADLLRRVTCKL